MIVLVTGLPAAGKSTLARLLAVELDLPVFSKDVVKEAMHPFLADVDRDVLSVAAIEAIWQLLPHTRRGAVIDAWFDPVRDAGLAAGGLARAGVPAPIVEIMCRCPGKVAAQRYQNRTRSPVHRPPDRAMLERIEASAALMEPLGVGPALAVDATQPFDIPQITGWIANVAVAAPS